MKNLKLLCETGVSYDEMKKNVFKSLGQKFLKEVTKHIPFKEVKISFNPGGIAVSGDHNLMGMLNDHTGIYVSFNADRICQSQILYRTVANMKDYSGGANNWAKFDYFENPAEFADLLVEHMTRRSNK